VRAVKVFQAAGEVQVDVVVAHPDAKAGARTHEAVNTGTARITLRADDGTVLATHAARAPLPVRVPQARQVMQTYRFALDPTAGAQVASAGRANVAVVAESRLDPDGPGPADPATDRDTDTADVAVENVDGVPPSSHYLDIYFATSHYCEIENGYCTAHFDSRSLPGPFRNETGPLRTQARVGLRGRRSSTPRRGPRHRSPTPTSLRDLAEPVLLDEWRRPRQLPEPFHRRRHHGCICSSAAHKTART
jgi:hypothetical protein